MPSVKWYGVLGALLFESARANESLIGTDRGYCGSRSVRSESHM
jgi:hypothetical protein